MNTDWEKHFQALHAAAVEAYRSGCRSPLEMFTGRETTFLASVGLRPINLYDYAEDFVRSGYPDWAAVLRMAAARREYFLNECGGVWPEKRVRDADLPPRKAAYKGVQWLPRIIRKAEGFLRGELCEEIMYCCGGDRSFLRRHHMHPADFLHLVKRHRGDHASIHSELSANE